MISIASKEVVVAMLVPNFVFAPTSALCASEAVSETGFRVAPMII